MALSISIRGLIPLRSVLKEVGVNLYLEFSKTELVHLTVFEDNNGAMSFLGAPKLTYQTKHIGIKYHWFRSHVGDINGIVLSNIES